MDIKDRFTKAIERIGLTKQEISKELGISYRDLWRYETGLTKKIGPDVLHLLHSKYGIDLNWLLSGEGELQLNYQPTESQQTDVIQEKSYEYKKKCASCLEKERLILQLERENERLWKLVEGNKQERRAISG